MCSNCLQNTFNHSKQGSIGLSIMQVAAFVALLLLCTSPLDTVAVPIADKEIQKRSAVGTRNLCSYFSVKNNHLSCSYHDSCVELTFQCSSDGFHMDYSKPRCEAAKQLRQSPEECGSCLKHQEFVDWALETEQCFQPRLQELAKEWSAKIAPLLTPDPQTRIEYELEALNKLRTCYSEKVSPVCALLSNESNSDLVSDLKKFVSAMSISKYYSSAVREHLRATIEQCSSEAAISVANEAIPRPNKTVLFCAASTKALDETKLRSKVSLTLDRSIDEFTFADNGVSSEKRDSQCQIKSSPTSIGGTLTGYRLIQWTPDPSDSLVNNLEKYYQQQISPTTTIIFYNYSLPLESSCGNGLREAGEICDAFGEMLLDNKEFGCNSNCRPYSTKYECSTDQLVMSSCSRPKCGDGKRSSLEECDDGNIIPGDGCNKKCEIEPNSECTELSYNTTSVCKPVEQVSSSVLLPVITPSSVSSVVTATPSSSKSPVTIVTTTIRTVAPTSIIVTESKESASSAYSSAHSILRDSSMLWVTMAFSLLSMFLLIR